MQAAMLRVKLRHLDQMTQHKRALADIYFENLPSWLELPRRRADEYDVFHIFGVRHGRRDELRAWLLEQGVRRVALVGHSFGAAVVINAGAQHPAVTAVVTLSAQTFGTRLVSKLAPRPLLLVHGADDDRLPPSCSEYLYARAGDPRELVILREARHSLRQRRDVLYPLLLGWLTARLGANASATPPVSSEQTI